jgi:PAS domain-containing protein
MAQFEADSAGDIVIRRDAGGGTGYDNDKACRLYGWSRDEMLSQQAVSMVMQMIESCYMPLEVSLRQFPTGWNRFSGMNAQSAACQSLHWLREPQIPGTLSA